MIRLALAVLVATAQSLPQVPSHLQQSDDTAWTILQNGLNDKSADKRGKAVHALGILPNNAKATAMAENALTDPNADVRVQAAIALGAMGATSAQPKLKDALKDKDLKVVVAAANTLYLFKNPAAYDIYYALLTGERKGPGLVQSQLETLKDKKQLEKLMFETGIGFVPFGGMGYEAFKTITHDDTSLIIAAATEKLVTDPDAKTTAALGRACSDKKWRVRVAAVDTIAKRGDPALLVSVTPLLYDSNEEVRFEAAAATIRLTAKRPARKIGT
jgi:HEAT repeat protein